MSGAPRSADEVLTTTRAVRRRLDLTRPVDPALLRECLAIALQAPSGGNDQGWHFVVVTDPTVRAELADRFRAGAIAYAQRPRRSPLLLRRTPAWVPSRKAARPACPGCRSRVWPGTA